MAFRDFNNRSARIVVTLLLAGLAGVVLIQVARYRESPTDLAGPLSHIEAMVKEIRDFLLLPHGTNPAPNGASAPGKPARLIASLDYVAGGCVNSDSVITSDLARTVLLYVVTLRAEDGDVKIDESSIACSAKTTSGPNKNQEEYFAGKSTTDLYGVAFYEMGGAESINAVDWLAEAAFAGPIRAGDGIRKRVACEMGQDSPGQRVGNPMKVFYSYYKPIYEVSFKDATGKSYALTGQWAEPPMPLRKRSVLRPNLDRRFLGLPMDNLPPRLSDVKPAMLINFAGRVSPDGKPVPDSIPWDDPTSKSNYFGFEQCSHH